MYVYYIVHTQQCFISLSAPLSHSSLVAKSILNNKSVGLNLFAKMYYCTCVCTLYTCLCNVTSIHTHTHNRALVKFNEVLSHHYKYFIVSGTFNWIQLLFFIAARPVY